VNIHPSVYEIVFVFGTRDLLTTGIDNWHYFSAGELNLVAMAEGGTRLYFTCVPRPGLGVTPATRPSTLKLCHVRLPPGFSPMSNMKRPSGSHIAYYGNGTLC
jgi:hypothetical protein